MTVTKSKVSLTISTELVQLVDREAQRTGTTRSAIFEQYVRAGSHRAAERSLDELTTAYYASLTQDDRAENEAIARASSRSARTITYDVASPARGRSRRRDQR